MRFYLLLLSLVSLVGCSRAKLAWRLADDVVRYETAKHFDLTSSQKDQLGQELELLKIDFEKNELKDFVRLTKEAQSFSQTKFQSREKYEELRKELERILKSAGNKMTPIAQKSLANLSDEQWAHFEKKMRAQFAEDQKKFAENEFQKNAKDRWLRVLDYFFGSMKDEQEKMIEKFIVENPFPHQLRLQNQEKMLEQFLNTKSDLKARNIYLQKFFEQHDELRTPEYHQKFMEFQDKLSAFVFQLLQTMNEKQITHFVERMQNLQEAFEEKAQE